MIGSLPLHFHLLLAHSNAEDKMNCTAVIAFMNNYSGTCCTLEALDELKEEW